jgi:NADPH2:quinone reductase
VTGGAASSRAAVLAGPRRIELTTRQLGEPGPGRVRVEVEGCGVCGSNVPVWQGRPWFTYPLPPGAPGHEGWGSVAALGPGVEGPPLGTRVAFLCDDAFADAADVDAALVVPLPDAIRGPFPGEALGCAFNVAARSGFAPGQVVAVVGAGFLGTLVGALAAEAGAHVVALSRKASALEAARAFGAKDTVRLGAHGGHGERDDAVAAVLRLTGGVLCDVVVEAAGAQEPLDLAGQLTGVRGRLVIAGYHQESPRAVDMQLWNWRGIDVVNAHERDDAIRLGGIRAAVDAVASGRLDPTPLYTHRVPLERLADALDAVSERPEGFGKAVVTR